MLNFKDLLAEHGSVTRFEEFQNLIPNRITEILLVSSLYDSFILEEDGRLSELLLSEYLDLNLSNAPIITRVSSGREALALAGQRKSFGLVITTMNLGDMSAVEFARAMRLAGHQTPLVLLVYDSRELLELSVERDVRQFLKVFMWQGDFRTLLAIIKFVEDRLNVEHDTGAVGVQSILIVEDNVSFYSSFLPLVYSELFRHSQSLMAEGINLSHKILRMRARPKILLASTYEEAEAYYQKYQDCVLGVISDVEFPRNGELDSEAGMRFAREVRASHFDIPIVLQSENPDFAAKAHSVGAGFLLKKSPVMMQQLREFMVSQFSFGDFVFRMPDGREVGRADSLRTLENQIKVVPEASIRFHAERNHFSNWLKARTEFWLAHQLRPRKPSDFSTAEALRNDLIWYLREFRHDRQAGSIADFDRATFDPVSGFARIGGGSLGGKARGLGFVKRLLKNFRLHNHFQGISISVPPAVVLGTTVFDQFLDMNNLRSFALECSDNEEILSRFLAGRLPDDVMRDLAGVVELFRHPLAVRSSSLLEDSRYQPFAGIYSTEMIPNNHRERRIRVNELAAAIKRVYASTFTSRAKAYIAATPYRLEEEKMAIIIQKLVGARHNDRFYPTFAGVARSYNFYPHPPLTSADGIVSVALGLGTLVVDGGTAVRFSPKFPRHLLQFSNIDDTLRFSQREFAALELEEPDDFSDNSPDLKVKRFGLDVAEKDGTLHWVASTYSHDNNAIFDGLSRQGIRIVTFAPILKSGLFPLAELFSVLLEMGAWGMGSPVEMEFAVNLTVPEGQPAQFALLQMRPLVASREMEDLEVEDIDPDDILCQSPQVLGNGMINEIYDVIMVDPNRFRRDKSRETAKELSRLNAELSMRKRPYLLIGMGRWGSSDPWLGIPVTWDQISGARAVVETGFKDIEVTPSQGSHFFQNITSFRVGYFTVNPYLGTGRIDWEWLENQRPIFEGEFTRHLRFEHPILIKMNGRTNHGVILKPME
jgi:CheY-like chemotaxis protein